MIAYILTLTLALAGAGAIAADLAAQPDECITDSCVGCVDDCLQPSDLEN